MKHIYLLIAIVLFSVSAKCQTVATWKERVTGNWKYIGTEQFGVVDSATTQQQSDMLELNADGTYHKTEDSIQHKGTYTIGEGAGTLTLKQAGGKPKTYNLKKADADRLVIEFQTPDLIRTRYTYVKQQ